MPSGPLPTSWPRRSASGGKILRENTFVEHESALRGYCTHGAYKCFSWAWWGGKARQDYAKPDRVDPPQQPLGAQTGPGLDHPARQGSQAVSPSLVPWYTNLAFPTHSAHKQSGLPWLQLVPRGGARSLLHCSAAPEASVSAEVREGQPHSTV